MARHDFNMNAGETWLRRQTHAPDGSPVDLSAHTARMEIRSELDGFGGRTLSTADTRHGTITLGADGVMTLEMTPEQTSALVKVADFAALSTQREVGARRHAFFYDLTLTAPDGSAVRALEGRILFYRELAE